jgi:hypothetical protein
VKDDGCPGRPRTSVTASNIEKVREVIRKDRRLGVQAIAEMVNLGRENVRSILTEELNMRKVCVKMVPEMLSAEQKELRKEICSDLLQCRVRNRFVEIGNSL